MITSFRHDRKRVRRRTTTVVVVLLALALASSFSPVSRVFGGAVAFITSPIFRINNALSDVWLSLASYVEGKQHLIEENKRLSDLLETRVLESYELDMLRKENEGLKRAFGRLPQDHTYALAAVLASPKVTPYDTLLIDLGMYEGVGEGMLVYTDGGFAVGEIQTAYRHSSLVALYSTSGSEIQAYVGSSTIPVIAHGVGGGNFRVSLPKGTEVHIGDSVSLPAFSPTFLAVVEGVDTPINSSFSIVYMKLPFNYQSLRSVYVGIPAISRKSGQ